VVDLQHTFARNVRLSAISLISSSSSPSSLFIGIGFTASPSLLSLVFDSAADASSGGVMTFDGETACFGSPSFSGLSSLESSFLTEASIGLLGPATTVEGSAVSRALKRT